MSLYQGDKALNPSLKHAENHAKGASDEITPESIGACPKPTKLTLTLSSSGWDSSAKTQTVTAIGILADETKQIIQPCPASSNITAYYDSGILCTSQSENSLTFTADSIPLVDLTVYIVIQEV